MYKSTLMNIYGISDNLILEVELCAIIIAIRKEILMIQHTYHSEYRSAQRGLTNEAIDYITQYGSTHHCAGALFYYLRNQDLPGDDRHWDWALRLVGTALVYSKDDRILITVWRNRKNGLKKIRKKNPYDSKYS